MRLPILFAVMTALFWGLYGPVLAESRGDLKSPFKPYLAIGLAYLAWGVVGGLVGMVVKGDNFQFPLAGSLWGLSAGTLGAWGALTLTLAMYNDGKPYVVMPIVFGGAVTVSAIASIWKDREHVEFNPLLGVGIAGIVVCATLVAYYTPHPKPPGKGGQTPPHAPSVEARGAR